jgi:hypothetical protein
MCRFIFLGLLLSATTPNYLWAAPVPERKGAKPAVINAGTQQNLEWVQQRLVSYAHIAILQEKKVAELAIVRRHISDPKDTKELVSWLEKNFRFARVPDTKLLRVSFRDGTPEEQAAIINLVVEDFLKRQVGDRRDSMTQRIKSIRKWLADPDPRARRELTQEKLAEAEKLLDKHEEYIRTLPALVERAKVR